MRFDSMVVPTDRSAGEQGQRCDSLPPAPVLLLNFDAAREAKPMGWLPLAASAVTASLLIPILCVALFPVSVLALFLTPFAGAVYAATFAARPPRSPERRTA